mgnify:CR=1 FL=1
MKFKNKKSLGQNFLIDKNILKKIIDVGKISENDKVIEVGPGNGNLTEYLIDKNSKYLKIIEKDNELIKILSDKFKDQMRQHMRGSSFDQQDNPKKEGEVHLRSKKSSQDKINSDSVGDYVDFEEIE